MPEDIQNGQGQESDTADSGGMYDKYLEQFPEDYRETATGIFKEWDSQVTKKFQEYEPYKEFIDYDPQVIYAGINLLSKVAENPKEVYDLMSQTYGFGNESGQGQVAEDNSNQVQPTEKDSPDQTPQPDYEHQIEELRQMLTEQQAQQEQNAAMEEFQGVLRGLKDQYGDYDDDFVLAKIAAGFDPEDAVKAYMGFVEQISGKPAGKQPDPYPVLGGSGGVPSNEMDFVNMGSKETKDIIAAMLQRAAEA